MSLSFFNGTFYFALVGAAAAAAKHALRPLETMKELSPVALRKHHANKKKNDDDKDAVEVVSDEALWWGCYAFSAMNVGYATVGLCAHYTNSDEAKSAMLLGTGVMFESFAVAWLTKGRITQKKDYRKQAIKIACLGVVFLAGFASGP